MTRRARRNAARLSGLAPIALAMALLAGAGSADADEAGATLEAKGWWSRAQDSSLPVPLPAPPNVSAGQLNVQGNPTDAKGTAYAAVRYTIGANHSVKSLTLKVADGNAAATAVLLACQTGSTWTGVENGTWQSAPQVSATCINGQKAADGTAWTFAVGPLQLGTLLDIAIVPGADPETKAPATFALVFDAPESSSVETSAGPPPTVSTISNNFTTPQSSAAGATGGSGAAFNAPAVTPVATGLPADKVGETATAPSKQVAAPPVNTAAATPAKDRNKLPGYIVLAFAAAVGLYAWRQDNLMAMNGGTLPGASAEAGGLGRFASARRSPPGTDLAAAPPNLGLVEALAGPVVVVAALLALAGGLKVVRPAPTAGALRSMRLPSSLPLVRLLGLGEVTIGLAAGITFARPLLVLLAASYLAFAGFVIAALTAHTPLQSCGCFGQTDTPPSAIHVGLNLSAAGTAFAAALSGTPNLEVTMSDQSWGAVPFVLLVCVCVYLCVLAATVMPVALGSAPRP